MSLLRSAPPAGNRTPAQGIIQLQQMVGNAAVTRLIQRDTPTAAGAAATAMAAGKAEEPEEGDCGCGASCGKCGAVSRSAADDPEDEAGSQQEPGSYLVDADPGPGQMTKDQFLAELQEAVTSTASAMLAPTGWTADNCPDLRRWFDYYQGKEAAHVERVARRYAPDAAEAESARDYIPAISSRVQRAVLTWTLTGEVTEVPEDMAASPGAPPVPDTDSVAAALGSESGEPGTAASGDTGAASAAPAPAPVQLASRNGDGGRGGSGGGRAPGASPTGLVARLGQGSPLDAAVASRFGSALGGDFSGVRVHIGPGAAAASSDLGARAFTYGRHVAFDAGEYRPGTLTGDAVLAHELAHVQQQQDAVASLDAATQPRRAAAGRTDGLADSPASTGADVGGSGSVSVSVDTPAFEADADRAATGAMARLWGTAGRVANGVLRVPERLRASRPRLQRCDSCSGGCTRRTPPLTAAPGDYLIEGLSHGAAGRQDDIFFERDQSAIPATETGKITKIANPTAPATAADPLALFGYASEDETSRPALAQARMDTVAAATAAASPAGASVPTKTNRHNDTVGRIDYREVRMVETVRGTAVAPPASDQPACQPGVSSVVPCTPQQTATLNTGVVQGATWIQTARDKVNVDDPAAVALVAQLFTGGVTPIPAGVKTAILANLDAWKTFVGTLNAPAKHECRQCGDCENTPAFWSPSTTKMTLCPTWLDGGAQDAIGTLVHEAGHGTPGVTTTDHAYGHTRRILALTQAEALQNTDSYVLLIRSLNGHGVTIGPATPDDVSALSSGGANPETTQARRALGWAENHLVQAYQLASDAYAYAKNCRDQSKWIDDGGRGPMEKVSARLPGITTPGAVGSAPGPTEADQHALAAVHDRYHAMRSIMWGKPIKFVKGATDNWAHGPGSTVTLSPSFFTLTPRQQLDNLLELIVAATPGISSGLRPRYLQLIDDLRQLRGVGAP